MIFTKRKKLNNVSMFLLQLSVVVAFSFLFFNQQLVLFVKDFFNSLPFPAENLESFACRVYGIIKLSLFEPKIIQFVLIFLQVVFIKDNVNLWINYIAFLKPNIFTIEKVDKLVSTYNQYQKCEQEIYLENVRLLN